MARPIATALPLPPGKRSRLLVEQFVETEDATRVAHSRVDLVLRDLLELQPERHVVEHGHVRIERVVLEHHRDVALFGRDVVDDAIVDLDRALRHRLESGDHPQRRRLAATRRADEHDELAVDDVEIEATDGFGPVRIDLPDVLEDDLGHDAPRRRCSLDVAMATDSFYTLLGILMRLVVYAARVPSGDERFGSDARPTWTSPTRSSIWSGTRRWCASAGSGATSRAGCSPRWRRSTPVAASRTGPRSR